MSADPHATRRSGAPHCIAIVGGGFADLFAAKALERETLQVAVIDPTSHCLFLPLLHQIATGILSEGDIVPPIRGILPRQRNAKVMSGEVEARFTGTAAHGQPVGPHGEIGYGNLILGDRADRAPGPGYTR